MICLLNNRFSYETWEFPIKKHVFFFRLAMVDSRLGNRASTAARCRCRAPPHACRPWRNVLCCLMWFETVKMVMFMVMFLVLFEVVLHGVPVKKTWIEFKICVQSPWDNWENYLVIGFLITYSLELVLCVFVLSTRSSGRKWLLRCRLHGGSGVSLDEADGGPNRLRVRT